VSSRQKRWLVLTVVAAAALRLWCFIGYARGDDPLYVMIPKRILDEGLHFFTPQTFAYGVNYRMGLYILFYLLVPALAYVVVRTPRRAAIVLLWLVPLALLLEFMPMRFHPLVLSPRYVRYLNGLLAPAALVVAIPLGALWRRSRFLVGGILIGIAAASIHDARAQQRVWLDGTSDARHASHLLWQLPPKPVFSDGWFCDRYRFDGGLDLRRLVGRDCTDEIRGHKFTWLVAQGKTDQLASLPPGYVVAGGSRVHYALVSSRPAARRRDDPARLAARPRATEHAGALSPSADSDLGDRRQQSAGGRFRSRRLTRGGRAAGGAVSRRLE